MDSTIKCATYDLPHVGHLALSPRSLARFGVFPELALLNLGPKVMNERQAAGAMRALGLAGLPELAPQQTRRLTLGCDWCAPFQGA